MAHEKDAGMENNGAEAPMYSDSYLLPILQELHKPRHIFYPWDLLLELFLEFAEDFIKRATGTIEQSSKDSLLDGGKGTTHAFQILEDKCAKYTIHASTVPRVIQRLSSQITSEILNGNDTHSITLKVLEYLSGLGWTKKAAVTLVAFAVTFGDFWLLVRIYADNVINEPTTGDQRELVSANKEAYTNQIEANNDFMKILVNSLRHIWDIVLSPYGDVVRDQPAINVYWIVRCAIVAATQIIALSSRGLDQYLVGIRTPTEVEKLKSLNEDLILTLSKTKERKRGFETINSKLSNQVDVVGIMRVLVTDNDMPPLYHGETKRKDHLDVLRGKRVLLLISGIDIPSEDITSLKRVTVDTKTDEIVWIPVINRSITKLDTVKNQLETLQNSMSWYSVQPSMVTDDAIYFFEIKWHFKGGPILVLLDSSGYVTSYNAIHMVRIWQNLSFDDFKSYMERQLWEKETWNLKLLVNDITDPIMHKWIQDERYIIMYEGSDIDWIRRFTRQAHSVASDLQARIEMVYVGNRHNKDLVHGVRNLILSEQLSHCLPESSIAYFRTRVDSMIQSGRWAVAAPRLFEEIIKGLYSNEEWALLARGSTILANGPGQIALNALNALKLWTEGRQSC